MNKDQTRHELALEMLDAHGHMLPHAWITGDDEMGRPTHFSRALRERGERYLLAVPLNTAVRDLEAEPPVYSGHGAPRKCRFMAVNAWREKLPEEAWTTVTVREGEKRPLEVRITKCRVHARTEGRDGSDELLVVVQRREGKGWHTDYSSIH